ncbi:MAG: sensor histidine kinase [Planctomycetaceae bacterium]
MLFKRTIRRKMAAGLAGILLMLATLTLSGISGLISYRNAVHDLEFSIQKAPRRAELVESVAILFEPLRQNVLDSREGAAFQQAAFAERLELSRKGVLEFQTRLDALPPSQAVLARKPITLALLADLSGGLDRLDLLQSGLADPQSRRFVAHEMLLLVADLQTIAQRVPDHRAGLGETLRKARGQYRSRFYWVCGTSAATWALSLLLVRYGYTGVFQPLQELHRGARRVAQGDFDYRLSIATRDEMAELADAFNQMTARFQEITADLDRQVQDRSRQLVRSERLASVGFLAAGVAHEINNPLQAILTASDSLESRAEEFLHAAPDEEARVVRLYLGMIQSESTRCKHITARLLDFARGQETARATVDLTAVISEVLTLVGVLKKYRDRHVIFEPAAVCDVEANAAEIKQVVLNLIANAFESMEPGGTLTITLTEQTDQVHLRFEDEGCGMSPEVIAHLFEPFFTKKAGKGTGLGLSISHRIISDHGGTIEAHSDGPGQGCVFHVSLPRRSTQVKAA